MRRLALPGLQDREKLEKRGELLRACGRGKMVSAEIEVLAYRHVAEELAALGTLDHAGAGDRRTGHAIQVVSAEADRSLVGHQTGDGVE
jgi:hypothetical protein